MHTYICIYVYVYGTHLGQKVSLWEPSWALSIYYVPIWTYGLVAKKEMLKAGTHAIAINPDPQCETIT